LSRKNWIAIAIGVVITLAAAFGIPASLELPLRDLALRRLPRRAAQSTVVIAIDEESLQKIGRWPWRRAELANLIDRLVQNGARAVAIDVLLAEPDADDARLAESMRRIPTMAIWVLKDRREWLMPAPLLRAAAVPVHGNFEVDHDGILRRFASTKQDQQTSLPALSVAAAAMLVERPVPVGISISPQFRTRPRDIPVISAADTRAFGAVRGKVAFIGATAYALSDRVLTPVSSRSPEPGVMIHAAATESLVRGETIREVAPLLSGVAGALIVAAVIDTRRRRRTRILIDALAVVVIMAAAFAFLLSGIAIPAAALLLAVVICAFAVEIRMLRRSEVSLEEIATRLAEQRARDIESKRVLAHELKTPIASMRGLTHLLAAYSLSDVERNRVAALLEEEAGKLQSMVSGLLDLERLPLRDFDASTSLVNLGDVAAKRAEFLRASTDATIETDVAGDLDVRADPVLLDRIIDNLVGNALKYAPGSPVVLRVRRDANAALIEVEDRGPGIAAIERERIFERFVRGSSATGTDGLGLGLALVGEVARWHRGGVRVEEGASGGALFRVTLPLAGAV
jgi:signal transduction histidine kinase